jgi:hypothetical protein
VMQYHEEISVNRFVHGWKMVAENGSKDWRRVAAINDGDEER